MLSREEFIALSQLLPLYFRFTPEHSSAWKALFRAIDNIRREQIGAWPAGQLTAAEARREALAVDDAMAAQDALAAAGVRLSVQGDYFVVSRFWSMAPWVAFERDAAE